MDCKRAQSMVTPYILKKLNDRDMGEFLEHISHCGECYEELEIYFTIHYTLGRLDDEEGNQVYDVKTALHENLAESRFHVWKVKVCRIVSYGVMMFAELFLLLVILSQVQFWQTGSMESNPVYHFINNSENMEDEPEDKLPDVQETENTGISEKLKTVTADHMAERLQKQQREVRKERDE